VLIDAMGAALATRGAVYVIHHVVFGEVVKAKYCVLMEDYVEGAETLIVAFTSSRLEFSYRRSTVTIPNSTIKGLDGDSLLDCNNYMEVEAVKLIGSKGINYLGHLHGDLIELIDEALEYVTVDEHVFLRMIG